MYCIYATALVSRDSIVASFSPEQPVHHPSALCVTPCGSLLIANTDAHTHFWDINKGMYIHACSHSESDLCCLLRCFSEEN